MKYDICAFGSNSILAKNFIEQYYSDYRIIGLQRKDNLNLDNKLLKVLKYDLSKNLSQTEIDQISRRIIENKINSNLVFILFSWAGKPRDKKSNIVKLDNNTAVIYRNYREKLDLKQIIKIRNFCHNRKIKFFLSNNFKVALKLKCDGAYIPSFNKSFQHLSYKFRSRFILLGSAHNIKEIRIKEKQNVNLIFISSLFKNNKNYLGIYKFKFFENVTKRKLIALGGINEKNIKKLGLLDIYGYAGISFFQKKRPLKKGAL